MRVVVVLLCLGLSACSTAPVERVSHARPVRPSAGQVRSPTQWQPIATSALGSPIEAVTLGHGPRRVLIIGGIHGDEREPAPAVEALRRQLVIYPPSATVRIIRDINPDGSAAGTRGNAHGIDLNRNWPAVSFRASGSHGPSPLSEPESRALFDQIQLFAPDLVIVCHSAGGGPFVNFDGPAADIAQRFADTARATDLRWHVRPYMGYETPGSLGSSIGLDRGIPILTIEFARGHDPTLARMALIDGVTAVMDAATDVAR